MEKCNCIRPPENNDTVIHFCGRCQGVIDDENVFTNIDFLTPKTFEEAVKPLMKWIAENNHPHVTVIATGNRAELMEGIKNIVTDEYILD